MTTFVAEICELFHCNTSLFDVDMAFVVWYYVSNLYGKPLLANILPSPAEEF